MTKKIVSRDQTQREITNLLRIMEYATQKQLTRLLDYNQSYVRAVTMEMLKDGVLSQWYIFNDPRKFFLSMKKH